MRGINLSVDGSCAHRLQLTFDTGSSEIYVTPKTGYPADSQTAVSNHEALQIHYDSGDVCGMLYNDTVALINTNARKSNRVFKIVTRDQNICLLTFMFAEQLPNPTVLVMAAFSNSSCEAAQKDGNMGWTFATTKGTPFVPFVTSLWNANAIPEHLFHTSLTMNTTGSILTVGKVDKSIIDELTLVSCMLALGRTDGHSFSQLLWLNRYILV